MLYKHSFAAFILLLPSLVFSQDGSISGATSSSQAAGYSCDNTTCVLPKCNCASIYPPGGLNPSEVPQFIVFSADDAVQSYTLDAVNQFLAQRMNPNGCGIKMTYFTSLNYTNYTLVTDWYAAGNEIADHTMTHVGSPPAGEIDGNLIALHALAGIPTASIKGFRAPYLNYTVETLEILYNASFTYDSSSAAAIPVTDPGTDAFWPYTLDHGMANDCLAVDGSCKGKPVLPGFWEIPMYAFFDQRGAAGPHLMDPWLDYPNGESEIDDNATLAYMKDTFTKHYTGNRQPIGLYTHPIHLSTTYPGVNPSLSTISMINAFLDWAQQQPDVWIVSNEQLLDWVQHPVPASQANSVSSLRCSTPSVDASRHICNGIPQNEKGLLSLCDFPDFPFFTCYGCPVTTPTVDNPNPAQATSSSVPARFRLPDGNCTTPFWDPIAGNCICTSSTCVYTDHTLAVGPNGANLTGGLIGSSFGNSSSSGSASSTFAPFQGNAALQSVPVGVYTAVVAGFVGASIGVWGVFSRL